MAQRPWQVAAKDFNSLLITLLCAIGVRVIGSSSEKRSHFLKSYILEGIFPFFPADLPLYMPAIYYI